MDSTPSRKELVTMGEEKLPVIEQSSQDHEKKLKVTGAVDEKLKEESNMKRLASLKQKKMEVQAQKQAIKSALSNVVGSDTGH